MARAGARLAKVTRVTGAGLVYVELADVAQGFEFGPVVDTVGGLTVGDRVVATPTARDEDELVVIGLIGGAPSGGGGAGGVTDAELAAALAGKVDNTDARLTDARTPTAHGHAAADTTSGTFDLARLPVAPSGTANETQIVRADDSRLSNARTPTAHQHATDDIVGYTAGADPNLLPVKVRATVSLITNWAPLTGTPVLDAYQTLAGDTVLLMGQTTASQNGLWLIPAGGGAWVRHPSADSTAKVSGMRVTVERGSARGGKSYRTTFTAHTQVLGTSAMTFVDEGDATAILTGTVALARLPVAASGVSSTTQVVRADDARLTRPATAAGSILMTPASGVSAITFPVGRFASPPVVHLTPTPTGNVALLPQVLGITTTGCNAYLYGNGGGWTTGNVTVYWTAIAAH